MCITYCTCDKGIHKISKNVLTFFIYVHVCALKCDKMKECGALMMNSLNWNQSKDFLSNNSQKKTMCITRISDKDDYIEHIHYVNIYS